MKPPNSHERLQTAEHGLNSQHKPFAQPPRYGSTAPKPSSQRLHRKQAAGYLGVSLSWLDKNRLTGLGPVFIAIGGRVVYDTADLEAFLERNRRTSTSQQY